jgi:Domain of unknown function (DUF892)
MDTRRLSRSADRRCGDLIETRLSKIKVARVERSGDISFQQNRRPIASSGVVGVDEAQTSMRFVVEPAAEHVSSLTQRERTRRISSCKREEGSNSKSAEPLNLRESIPQYGKWKHLNKLLGRRKSFRDTTKKLVCQKCKGMEGLIVESEEIVKEDVDDDLRDAGLILVAQRVEHYEIAGYGRGSWGITAPRISLEQRWTKRPLPG